MGNFINVIWNAEEQKKIKVKMFNTSVRQKANEKMQSELSYFLSLLIFKVIHLTLIKSKAQNTQKKSSYSVIKITF